MGTHNLAGGEKGDLLQLQSLNHLIAGLCSKALNKKFKLLPIKEIPIKNQETQVEK